MSTTPERNATRNRFEARAKESVPSTTEERLELDEFGETLPHSLPAPFRPARFPQIIEQERRAYRKLLRPLRQVRRETFRILGLSDPGRQGARGAGRSAPVAVPRVRLARGRRVLGWDAYSRTEWHKAVGEYLDGMVGGADLTKAKTGWWYSDAALPTEWKFGMEVGVDRAVLLTGAEEAALTRFDPAVREWFGDHAFDRLSDQGRNRLGDILTSADRPGGSVESIIRTGIEEGTNPMEVARELGRQYDHYEDYEFARLARTETAFAQEAGIAQELKAEGWTEIPGAEYPPYHPSSALPGTFIECPGGPRRVETLRPGDFVFTHRGGARALRATSAVAYAGPAVAFGRGGLTAEHPVVCSHGTWVRADFLPEWRLSRQRYEGPIYDIEVAEDETFLTNGLIAHNCVCSQSVDFDTGFVVPDVSASACEICQSVLIEATILIPATVPGSPFAE